MKMVAWNNTRSSFFNPVSGVINSVWVSDPDENMTPIVHRIASSLNIMAWKKFSDQCPLVGGNLPVDSPYKGPVMQNFDTYLLLAWTSCWTFRVLESYVT